jgi:hypothetical protein
MKVFFTLFIILQAVLFQAQEITLHALNWPSLPGLQSFTWGQVGDDYLVLGGRLDGLHRRQPFASFDEAGHHTQIQLLQPSIQNILTINTNDFPEEVQEQMHSTNACFTQHGQYLIIAGGYGYSALLGEHKTFNQLLILDLIQLRDAIINGTNASSSLVAQRIDEQFAVTGGKLMRINETYYLTVGHRFDGKYNPIGPDHGPGFTQQYTESIQRFQLDAQWNVSWLSPWSDSSLLHRRDLNVLPSLSPQGQPECIIYSGVFQQNADIPFLNAVRFDQNGFNEIPNFAQYYNHYHCATISMRDSIENVNTHYFLGGIAHYYDSTGILVQNNNVPFVRTIAKVVHSGDGTVQEFLLPIQMPGYLGAGSEFLPLDNIPHYENDMIRRNALSGDSVLIGYVYGGISSSAKNIFWTNEGDLSSAANLWLAVYYHPNANLAIQNIQSNNGLQLQVYPNPFSNDIHVHFTLSQHLSETLHLNWYDEQGHLISSNEYDQLAIGKNEIVIKDKENWVAGTYILEWTWGDKRVSQRVVFDP